MNKLWFILFPFFTSTFYTEKFAVATINGTIFMAFDCSPDFHPDPDPDPDPDPNFYHNLNPNPSPEPLSLPYLWPYFIPQP